MARRTARGVRAAALLAAPLLVLTACGGSGGEAASPAASSTSAAPEASSSSAAPSPSPSPSQESPSPEETASQAAEIELPQVPGYSYEDAPPEFVQAEDGAMSSGTATDVTSRSMVDSDGTLAAVLLAAQYKPELVENFGDDAAESVLAGAAASAKAGLPGTPDVASVTVGGTPLTVLSTDELTVAIAYVEGGLLVQFFGPVRADVVAAAKAFIGAQNG
jgi:hypothetical protein